MPQPAYPTAAEVQAFLVAGGVTVSSALLAQLPVMALAAIQSFESETDRKPLLAAAGTRRFDPPDTRDGSLYLEADLAAAPTSVSYQPAGQPATALVATTVDVLGDYDVEPFNASAKGEPFTKLVFRRWRYGGGWCGDAYRGSLYVTGLWGYGVQIPDDAWKAILRLAACEALTVLALDSGGVSSLKMETFETRYPAGGQYAGDYGRWMGEAQKVMNRYQRASL